MIRAALTVEEALEGMKALEPKIKNYARLVVRKGVNVKPGRSVSGRVRAFCPRGGRGGLCRRRWPRDGHLGR
mgnify:CR=1 FL=1